MFYLIPVLLSILPQASADSSVPVDRTIVALEVRADSGDVKAQLQLGLAYATGSGVLASDAKAIVWFRKAAEQGNAAGEYSLGEMYFTGRGVPRDLFAAAKWIRLSAEHGDARGQSNLAAMYLRGQGMAANKVEAAKWMRKAADQGLPHAEFDLGVMYEDGSGVPKNDEEAALWYRKAADQGDLDAMNNLAFLLATSTDPRVLKPREAIPIAQKTVELRPDSATYLDTLATAYFLAGQRDKAVETEKRALALAPDNRSYQKALQKYNAAK